MPEPGPGVSHCWRRCDRNAWPTWPTAVVGRLDEHLALAAGQPVSRDQALRWKMRIVCGSKAKTYDDVALRVLSADEHPDHCTKAELFLQAVQFCSKPASPRSRERYQAQGDDRAPVSCAPKPRSNTRTISAGMRQYPTQSFSLYDGQIAHGQAVHKSDKNALNDLSEANHAAKVEKARTVSARRRGNS